jgi:hypothetical protein
MRKYFLKVLLLLTTICQLSTASSQADRWQQRIKYNINVNMDVVTNRFSGTEKLEYTNNSPDTLNKVYFHLYWNAFQPGSNMDVRSIELGKTRIGEPTRRSDGLDWDARVKDRISKLTPAEIGYQNVKSIKINGVDQILKQKCRWMWCLKHRFLCRCAGAGAIIKKASVTA